MQNVLRELRLLAPHFRDRPSLAGARAEFFTSPAYLRELDALGNDPAAMARLTVKLLDHVALDPLQGKTLGDFLKVGSDAETVFVALPLNRTVNFVGYFTLPVTSPELPLLAKAIDKNLASRMFKAAVLHRRLDAGNRPRFRRLEKVASAAYAATYAEADANLPPVSPYASEKAGYERMATIRELASNARDNAYEPAKNRLFARIHAVARQAASTDFQGSYTDMLIAFASRHICPVNTADTCCA